LPWRLILGLVLGYVIFRLVKRAYRSFTLGPGSSPKAAPPPREPEVLVQDPMCGTFIPRKEALKTARDGKDFFFCSEGCLKRFRRGGPA
jgi:YHS domain-containing protein